MKRNSLWLFLVVMLAGFVLPACAKTPSTTTTQNVPGKAVPIEGTKLKRLTLIEEARKRLDLQTAIVREESVMRTRKVGAEVVAPTGTQVSANSPDTALVRVVLTESDLSQVDRTQLAHILSLDDEDEDAEGIEAEADEGPGDDDSEDAATTLYFKINDPQHKLVPGQRVLIELALAGGGQRKIIPYTAVLYDPQGNTWTYTTAEPLVYVRHPITVDYIDGDTAFLTDGPQIGTAVVTVGAAELFGLEFGAGK